MPADLIPTPAPTLPPLLFTEREAARMLSISPRTLWALAACGEIRTVKIGAAKRYPLVELRRWIDAKLDRRAGEEGGAR